MSNYFQNKSELERYISDMQECTYSVTYLKRYNFFNDFIFQFNFFFNFLNMEKNKNGKSRKEQ